LELIGRISLLAPPPDCPFPFMRGKLERTPAGVKLDR
jgi:hypothetical protein